MNVAAAIPPLTASVGQAITKPPSVGDDKPQQQNSDSDATAAVVSTLTEAELKQVQALKARDREVRAHEAAHLAAAGSLAIGGATYTYQRGPDGIQYAVGGEVNIDTSPVPGDPEATLQKAQRIRAAALAPAEPSAQDLRVAAQAAQLAVQARAEIARENNADNRDSLVPSETDSDSIVQTETTAEKPADNQLTARQLDTITNAGNAINDNNVILLDLIA